MTSTQTETPTEPATQKGPKLSPRDQLMLNALIQGSSYQQAADRSGHSLSTVKRRMADPGFRALLREQLAEADKQVTRRLTASTVAAIQVLTRLAGNVEIQPERTENGLRIPALRAAEAAGARIQAQSALGLLNAWVRLQRPVGGDGGDLTPEQIIDHVLVGVDIGSLR